MKTILRFTAGAVAALASFAAVGAAHAQDVLGVTCSSPPPAHCGTRRDSAYRRARTDRRATRSHPRALAIERQRARGRAAAQAPVLW